MAEGRHAKLDADVFAAYGWPVDITDDDLLARLLALNLARAPPLPKGRVKRINNFLASPNYSQPTT